MEKNHGSSIAASSSAFDTAAAAALLDDMIKKLLQTYADPDTRPVDELECYNDDGTLDMDRFGEYLEREDEEESAEHNVLQASLLWHLSAVHQQREAQKLSRSKNESRRPKKKRRSREPKFFEDPTTGCLRPTTPKLSLWWILYVQQPKPECKQWSKTFRNRFRLSHESYLGLLNTIKDDDDNDLFFRRWRNTTIICGGLHVQPARKQSPIELLLLGCLRYLGRGFTFDDLEECTYISRDVHRCFFHKFIEFGATKLFATYVKMPHFLQELQECEKAYRIAGFPGCIGSTDATHIPLEKVSFTIRQGHLGYKMSATTRTYNLTVNHKRQILHSTTGHPGRWNDKTVVRHDDFMDQLRRGSFDDMMRFVLLTTDDEGNQQEIQMKGAYVIVDNGYLAWSTTVPPLKDSINRSEIRFSQWLESLRKDVECTFGILKSRWRILKTGIRLHNTEVADQVWLTCCALHNLLLEVDGLSEGWQDGVPSYWQTDGNGDLELEDIPPAIQRLLATDPYNLLGNNNPSGQGSAVHLLSIDRSRFGYCCQDHHNMQLESAGACVLEEDNNNGAGIAVASQSLEQFRTMLINNFRVLFQQHRVVWPRRLPSQPRCVPENASY